MLKFSCRIAEILFWIISTQNWKNNEKKTVWKYHSVNVWDTILINSELFTLSKRNDGAVLAPVNDFTKNSRQSSNLSLIAAIYQDQILKGKKEQEIPQKVHNTIFDFNAEIYERQLLKLNKDKYLSLIGKKLLKILREMTLENAFRINSINIRKQFCLTFWRLQNLIILCTPSYWVNFWWNQVTPKISRGILFIAIKP